MGVQLTVEANYTGLAAHQEGFCLEDKNIYRWSLCLCDDVDMSAGDISYTVRRVVKQRGNESVCTWRRDYSWVTVSTFVLCCVYILCTVFLHHKYFCVYPLSHACVRACIVPPLQRDWCHKIAGVKFVHSDAHKRTFPKGSFNETLKRELCMKELFSSWPFWQLDVIVPWQSSASWRWSDVVRSNGWFGVMTLRVKSTGLTLQMLDWDNK